MLEEYQSQAQQVLNQLEQIHATLQELTATLHENYPADERTFRMHQAMAGIEQANNLVVQASSALHKIEWPTEDRPR